MSEQLHLCEADLAANQELDRRFTAAMSRMDVEVAMSCFWDSPHVLLVSLDGTVLRGSGAIREAIERMFEGMESVSLEIDEITHSPAPEGVVAVGIATYRMQPEDGPPQQVSELWTDVRQKVDDRWMYIIDHVQPLQSP